jgi:hypothetical protein
LLHQPVLPGLASGCKLERKQAIPSCSMTHFCVCCE